MTEKWLENIFYLDLLMVCMVCRYFFSSVILLMWGFEASRNRSHPFFVYPFSRHADGWLKADDLEILLTPSEHNQSAAVQSDQPADTGQTLHIADSHISSYWLLTNRPELSMLVQHADIHLYRCHSRYVVFNICETLIHYSCGRNAPTPNLWGEAHSVNIICLKLTVHWMGTVAIVYMKSFNQAD